VSDGVASTQPLWRPHLFFLQIHKIPLFSSRYYAGFL
jgi:hypothetical protein